MPKIVATQQDWIKLGYQLFSEFGEAGIVVDKMSRILKCNKSSFYWHFKSRSAFIDQILEAWIKSDTFDIISIVNQEKLPEDQFLKLIELSFRKDPNIDFIFFLKRYAKSNKRISKTIDTIDNERIAFVSNLLSKMGYTKKEADLKSKIFYNYLIGYHEMMRYKVQDKKYLSQVCKEINQFIKCSTHEK